MSLNWGNYPKTKPTKIYPVYWRDQNFPHDSNVTYLPHGCGKSYGDSCLNEEGVLLDTTPLKHMIAFDQEQGVLTCESGVNLADILQFAVPRGWFLPVLPGTKYITVGGAIANDIHGKNHHVAGTFGNHVLSFEIMRSDGSRKICSANENSDLFKAAIGGLGLTGLILSATIKLKPISSPFIDVENVPFRGLDEFFKISTESEKNYEYTVAWLDCLSTANNFARGIFFRGNHSKTSVDVNSIKSSYKKIVVPCYLPSFILNRYSIAAFNNLYFKMNAAKKTVYQQYYDSFFFPLDKIHNWNKIYGKQGFVQYQCVVPAEKKHVIEDILKIIVASKMGSFLSVLKVFGNASSPGLMSFPMPGITLALDFPFRGNKTLNLLNQLDELVLAAGGRVYPAKDARMAAETFDKYFPNLSEFRKYVDPNFSSNLWRRIQQ